MSQLLIHSRPWVIFDPANAQHRQYYQDFAQNKTWSNCPVRFILPLNYSDLVSMIQQSLADYYVNNEFTAHQPQS